MLGIFINTAYAVASADAIIGKIKTNIINPIVAVAVGLAFVMFLYGVLEYVQGGSNEKEIETGKKHIIWGIIGLVIMFGVNGIIKMITDTVNEDSGSPTQTQ